MNKRQMLNTRERFALQTLVKTEYTSSNKSDTEFAAHAREVLSNDKITSYHVGSARKDFDIPATATRYKESLHTDQSLKTRLTRVEGFLMKNFPRDWAKFVSDEPPPHQYDAPRYRIDMGGSE